MNDATVGRTVADGAEDESVRPLLEEEASMWAAGHCHERPRIPFPLPSILPHSRSFGSALMS